MSDSASECREPESEPAAETCSLRQQLRPTVLSVIALSLLSGGAFPLVLYAIGRPMFPRQANGSLVLLRREVIGSELIGQQFTRPEYFHPRPSAAGAGYDATASGSSNLGPNHPKLKEEIRRLSEQYRQSNRLAPDVPIPADAVTSSGSGLDPDISPENAALQAGRVARARGMSEDAVRQLVAAHTRGRQLGFLGSPRVSVLELNLALDRAPR